MSGKYETIELLESTETLATVVHAILRKQYGEEAYDWELVTILMEVQDDFKTNLSNACSNRWAAIQTVMTTDAFFKRPDAFLAVCNTLATGDPYFTVFDPITVEEAAWAISEVSLNRELLPFSYPIKQYIRQVLRMDGYSAHDVPDIFDAVLEPGEDVTSVRGALREISETPNRNNVEEYIDSQLQSMVSQFNKVPELSAIDNILMASESDTLVETL